MNAELMEASGEPVFTPRWDYWRCMTCMGYWVTVAVDAGHTPDKLQCKLGSNCKGTMASSGYRDPAIWPSIVPRIAHAEWYRPNEFQLRTLGRKTPKLVQYVRDGGLVARVASESTPMFPVMG